MNNSMYVMHGNVFFSGSSLPSTMLSASTGLNFLLGCGYAQLPPKSKGAVHVVILVAHWRKNKSEHVPYIWCKFLQSTN